MSAREDEKPQGQGGRDKSEGDSSGGPQVGTRYSADEIHENILTAAEEEMDRPVLELSYSGVAAGLGIGFSFLGAALLSSKVSPEYHDLATGLAYPLGFIFVVLARHQLFTENTLEPVIPVLERRTLEALGRLLRLWAIVLPANLVGAAVFAYVIAHTNSLKSALANPLLDVARESTSGGAGAVLLKAVWAGWLVALMAWLLASTRETLSQIVLIWLTTAPIAAFGFKHSIAGATEAFYRAFIGDAPFGTMMLQFELPALAGNIIGGVVLVALVNHGQTGSSKEK